MASGRERLASNRLTTALHWFIRIPDAVRRLLADKRQARAESERLAGGSAPPKLNEETVRELMAAWEMLRERSDPVEEETDCFANEQPDGEFPNGQQEETVADAQSASRDSGQADGESAKRPPSETERQDRLPSASGQAAAEASGTVRLAAGGNVKDRTANDGAGEPDELDPESLNDRVENGRAIVFRIRHLTEQANRNNVTRTEAYREFYYRNPDIHWALLAHIVSRNGGWSMTDLQGELLPRLFPPEQRKADFEFLERANALIFSDAYPQLLLYEAGKKAGRDYSCLVPHFGVSRLMEKAWAQYWKKREAPLLTTALIVNEQHFIERRLVRSEYYQRRVMERPAFQLQSPLQTNAVFMPYAAPMSGEMKLAGLVLEHFGELEERIEFGKRLYAILYGIPEVHKGVLSFVKAVHHSGSRADYAPHLFTYERAEAAKRKDKGPRRYAERMSGCTLVKGARQLYSPKLEEAWPDVPFEAPERDDWLDWAGDVSRFFQQLPLPPVFEITQEHCLGINKIELAVMAAERLKRR